ncbi:MAG: hypothetical protein IKJ74_06470 [Clostridia bacterium]|nr:hypothetical protein [Clostridia bacterium]
MKKILALLLAMLMLAGCLASCGSTALPESTETLETKETEKDQTPEKTEEKTETMEEKETESATSPAQTAETPAESNHMLNGKKVIFVGNSYTYYGNCVLTKSAELRTQSLRINDRGYFYQLCKEKGANVQVTNWTFANHGIGDLFESCTITKNCKAGYQHAADLKDAFYDYVFLQDRSGEEYTTDVVVQNAKKAVDFFRAANPDVKIFFFAQSRLYEWKVQWLPALKEIEKMGVTIIEWGALVEDVISGKTAVPGGSEQYDRNSFIINQSASDGYHPNMLSGYITAQMAYCAITGESAVGQPYAFCTDANILSAFNPASYVSRYYKNGATTNMLNVFRSPAEMNGLQTLMDQYLAAQNYKNY